MKAIILLVTMIGIPFITPEQLTEAYHQGYDNGFRSGVEYMVFFDSLKSVDMCPYVRAKLLDEKLRYLK